MINKIIYKKITDLKPYKGNPRINKNAVSKVADSIQNFGFNVPILITEEFEIISGHTRLKAAKNLKFEEVPCIILSDLNSTQVKQFRIADNKVAEESKWDFLQLATEIEELEEIDGIKLSDIGFSGLEIENIKELLREDEVEVKRTDKVTTNQLARKVRQNNNIVTCPECGHEIPLKTK